jgi:hypothetical protein
MLLPAEYLFEKALNSRNRALLRVGVDGVGLSIEEVRASLFQSENGKGK